MLRILNLYTIVRIFVILAKPISLLIVLEFTGSENANFMALCYLVGSISTVIFSFSSYRILIPKITQHKKNRNFYSNLQDIQIIIIGVSLLVLSAMTSYFDMYNYSALILIAFVEYAFHEKQRNYLYSGQLNTYAKYLIVGYVVSLSICLVNISFLQNSITTTLIHLASIVYYLRRFAGINVRKIKRYSKIILQIVMSERRNWTITGITRIYMSGDRLIVSYLSFENLWLITILSQYFIIPVIVYDLFHLGPNKHKIMKGSNRAKSNYKLEVFTLKVTRQVIIFFVVAMFLPAVMLIYVGPEFEIVVPIYVAILTIALGFLYALSEKLHELIFWSPNSWQISILYSVNFVFTAIFAVSVFSSDTIIMWAQIVTLLTLLKFIGLYRIGR